MSALRQCPLLPGLRSSKVVLVVSVVLLLYNKNLNSLVACIWEILDSRQKLILNLSNYFKFAGKRLSSDPFTLRARSVG